MSTKKLPVSTRRNLSHQQYFLLCEELRNQREEIMDKRPRYSVCCALLSDRLGFRVSDHSLESARKQTGVDWEPAKAINTKSQKASRQRAMAVLARELVQLCAELGVTPSQDIVQLSECLNSAAN